MTQVILLCNLKTIRKGKAVTLQANTKVSLSEEEVATLDELSAKTRKPHYRLPVNETVDPASLEDEDDAEDEDEADAEDDESEGAEKPLDKMTTTELKAYLDEAGVEYAANANKAALLTLAKTAEEDGGL